MDGNIYMRWFRGSTTAVEKSIKRNKVDARVVRSVPVASQQ